MELKEQLEQIVRVGREMRAAQNNYFRSKTAYSLKTAKNLEMRFDALLKQAPEVEAKEDNQQQNLF